MIITRNKKILIVISSSLIFALTFVMSQNFDKIKSTERSLSPPNAQETNNRKPDLALKQEITEPSIVSTNYQIMIEPIRILEDESLESALGILSRQIREQVILNDPFDNSVLSSHDDNSKSQPPAITHEQGKFESGMGLLTDTGETPENKVLHPQAMQVQPQPIKKKRMK